jgi:hypothetical protein
LQNPFMVWVSETALLVVVICGSSCSRHRLWTTFSGNFVLTVCSLSGRLTLWTTSLNTKKFLHSAHNAHCSLLYAPYETQRLFFCIAYSVGFWNWGTTCLVCIMNSFFKYKCEC